MEVFYNLYDKEGNVLRKIPEDRVKAEIQSHEYLKGVGCFVIQNKEVVFEERAPHRDGGGYLDICSGHVDNDELYDTAMVRELGEEMAIPKEVARNAVFLGEETVFLEKRAVEKNWIMGFYALIVPSWVKIEMQESEMSRLIRNPLGEAFEMIRKGESLQFPYSPQMELFMQKIDVLAK